MRIVLALVVPVILLFGLALLLMWLPLPTPLPQPASAARTALAAGVVGALGVVYLGGIAVLAVGRVVRTGRALDEVLLSEGMTVSRHSLIGRSYVGNAAGRETRILWVPGHGLQRGQLIVDVSGAFGFSMAIADHTPLKPTADAVTVPIPSGLGWTPTLLAPPACADGASRAILEMAAGADLQLLLAGGQGRGTRELTVSPDGLRLRARVTAREAQTTVVELSRTLVRLAGDFEASSGLGGL